MKKLMMTACACMTLLYAAGSPARELDSHEKKVIEDAARQQLKDPDSAKFYWQEYRGGEIYCAHVNAKNSYGGYPGEGLLSASVKTDRDGRIQSAEVVIDTGSNAEMMAPICTKRGYNA